MEIAWTIPLAFKGLSYTYVYFFLLQKFIKWQPEAAQGMGSTSLRLSII